MDGFPRFTRRTAAAVLASATIAGAVTAAPSTAADRPSSRPGVTVKKSTTTIARPAARTTGNTLVPLAANSFFLSDISKAPLAKDSATQAAFITKQVADYWGGVAAFNAYEYNISLYKVPAGTKKVDVKFWDCQHKGYTPSGLFNGLAQFKQVPIPTDAIPAKGTDGQLTIYDASVDKLWEFWQMRKNSAGQWEACWGGRLDNLSKSTGVFPQYFGAGATSIAGAPGAISIEDVRRGYINHALSIALLDVAPWNDYSWPATRSDGSPKSTSPIREGQRFRLDPTLDLNKYQLTPIARMVAVAAQKYGFIVDNRAGAVVIDTESGLAEKARTGKNPWDTLLGGVPPYKIMKNFPWNKTQFLPKDYGKPAS